MKSNLTSIRDIIGDVLCEAAKSNDDIFVIDSDLAKSTTTHIFREHYPDRFIETGIAEQNAMSIATGIAMEGKIPFYVNFAIFVSGTAWTQVRQACYANANIKLIATHPGMDGGYDGATHHANEDIALMRVLPNMVVLVPSNPQEFKQCIKQAINHHGPVYIRAARDTVPDLHFDFPCEIGQSHCIKNLGNDFTIIFEGSSATCAHQSFEEARTQGYYGKLINIYSIKPLDETMIRESSMDTKVMITIENHSRIGGLGSAIAEILSETGCHIPIIRIGVDDVFTESGPSAQIKEKYGCTVQQVLNAIVDHQ